VFACWTVAYENPAVKLTRRSTELNILTEITRRQRVQNGSEYCSDNDVSPCLVSTKERLVFVKQIGMKMKRPLQIFSYGHRRRSNNVCMTVYTT
jgi:hypothetical protein